MSYRILLIVLLSILLSPTLYSSDSAGSDADESTDFSLSTSSSKIGGDHVVIEMGEGVAYRPEMSRFASTHELPAAIHTLYGTDVPGLEDDCLRCSICFWRLGGNVFETLATVTSLGGAALSALVLTNLLDESAQSTCTAIAAVAGVATVVFMGLGKYSKEAVVDRREDLRAVLRDHGIDVPADSEFTP